MSPTGSNPPMPNPRQSDGILITVGLPSTLPASRFREGDVFAFPEKPNEHLTIETVVPHPEYGSRLIITANGRTTALTLHVDEPVRPVRMRRTIQVTCQLCDAGTTTDLDLVAHGEPKTWVCSRH